MVWERIGMFSGLGIVIAVFAAIALGRTSVIGVRDVAVAQARQRDRDIDLNRTRTDSDTTADTGTTSSATTRLRGGRTTTTSS
jgi:hypothetical protein